MKTYVLYFRRMLGEVDLLGVTQCLFAMAPDRNYGHAIKANDFLMRSKTSSDCGLQSKAHARNKISAF